MPWRPHPPIGETRNEIPEIADESLFSLIMHILECTIIAKELQPTPVGRNESEEVPVAVEAIPDTTLTTMVPEASDEALVSRGFVCS